MDSIGLYYARIKIFVSKESWVRGEGISPGHRINNQAVDIRYNGIYTYEKMISNSFNKNQINSDSRIARNVNIYLQVFTLTFNYQYLWTDTFPEIPMIQKIAKICIGFKISNKLN